MLAGVVALGINLMAVNEKPSDAMKAVMNANSAANADVRAAQKANNFDGALATVAAYKANFAFIDAYFTHKKVDAAATIAKNGMKAAMELETAAMKKDAAALEKAVAGVTGTCGGCHKQFREQLPDKTYEIKLP
jgi:cytochrome c556